METGREQRAELLRMQFERLCHAYTVARSDHGMAEPVIWLVDKDDRLGRDLCLQACGGDPARLQADSERLAPGMIGAYLIAIERRTSITLAKVMSPTGYRVLEQVAPANRFHAVVVSGGGSSYGLFPMPP